MMTSLATLAVLAAFSAPGQTASQPASAPAEKQFGSAVAGVSASILPTEKWTVGGKLAVDLAIRNTGSAAVALPPREQAFFYLLLAQGKTAHYTEKLPIPDAANWPEKLAPDQTLELGVTEITAREAFLYLPGLKLVGGYPAAAAGAAQPAGKAGTVAEVLKSGPVKIKGVLHLHRPQERELTLEARSVAREIAAGDFAGLSPEAQQKVLNDLAERFRRDAASAMSAHAEAVRIGKPALATLLAVVRDERAPAPARMWAATALADIGDAGVSAPFIEWLTDPMPQLRNVVAYHGVKLKDAAFDAALDKRAIAGDDPELTTWAIMGYLRWRGQVPPGLLAAGPENKDWRVRAAVAETISRSRPERAQLPVLLRLLKDDQEKIRASAARSIQFVGDRSAGTIDALVAALPAEGESARQAVAAALSTLTRHPLPYTAEDPPQARQETIERWQQWWHENRGKWAKE